MKLFSKLLSFRKSLDFSIELSKTLRDTEWWNAVPDYFELEQKMCESFAEAHSRRFREGHLKTSFVYLLIDPRVSDNLPGQYKVSYICFLEQKFNISYLFC